MTPVASGKSLIAEHGLMGAIEEAAMNLLLLFFMLNGDAVQCLSGDEWCGQQGVCVHQAKRFWHGFSIFANPDQGSPGRAIHSARRFAFSDPLVPVR
jgi:hypothetical protein